MKRILILLAITSFFVGCEKKINKNQIQGKIENEQIAVVSKIPGKILKIFVKEGDLVKKGDTLAILDIPEVDAKKKSSRSCGNIGQGTIQHGGKRRNRKPNQTARSQKTRTERTIPICTKID